MKKLLVFAVAAMLSGAAFAATGWYQDYVLVSNNGGADGYYWIGDDPGFGTQFAGSTFNITYGQALDLGADMKYWSDNQDRTGGAFYWKIDSGSFTEVLWAHSYLGGNDYQGLEPTENNVAAGLNVGSYAVAVYAKSWGSSQGDSYLSNAGNNYVASLVIGKATPTITTNPTASAIVYGDTLADSDLTGGAASVGGTFAFTTPATAPDAGTADQSVTFTPTDTTNYNAVVFNVGVTVDKADQTIDFPAIGNQLTTNEVVLSATATSGLDVDFSVASGPGSIDGGVLTFTGEGTVSIVAAQTGDSNWNAAPDATNTFDVTEPALAVVVNKDGVNVREAGEGRFFVRLNQEPPGNVTVAVARVSGDEEITLQGPASIVFKPADWFAWRRVTLEAAADGDTAGETATFEVSGTGVESASIEATALDDDGISENIALGAAIAGFRAGALPRAIDGVSTVSTNYAYTIWTNPAQGTITMDLGEGATVSRVRLLNWDWDNRYHRYTVESSTNGTAWTTLLDASGTDRQGWDDWAFSSQNLRYLRFTGLSNSVNKGICVAEWEVYGTRPPLPQPVIMATNVLVRENGEGRFYVRLDQAPSAEVSVSVTRSSGDAGIAVQAGSETVTFDPADWAEWRPVTLEAAADGNSANETATFLLSGSGTADQTVDAVALDDDIGENLALASGGTVASGTRVGRPAQVNDGVHAVSTNYAYTFWSNAPQGTLTLDLQAESTVSRVRLLNWDWDERSHRYTIESSLDGTSWATLIDASGEDCQGWDDWAVEDESIRYLRFTGLTNSVDKGICVAEWEVYGERILPPLVEFSKAETLVRENGQGRFYVRLSRAPADDATVAVSRSAGDADLTVLSGGSLTFTPANWSVWQAVTLSAADDEDADDGTATFQATTAGEDPQEMAAAELDGDSGTNLAIGGRVTGGSRGAQAIDGIHAVNSNYAYVNSTSVPPGSLKLDLKASKTISRIRVLNWDWTYRVHRYTIESSANGVDWTPLVDASGED
ncbi:MAG: discoidin domain-containing protein, partial [Kiritimatiellia bacterium]